MPSSPLAPPAVLSSSRPQSSVWTAPVIFLRSLLLAAAAFAAPSVEQLPPAGVLPAPPYGTEANGGWFGRERHIAPAASGKKPNIVMVLLDDWYACSFESSLCMEFVEIVRNGFAATGAGATPAGTTQRWRM